MSSARIYKPAKTAMQSGKGKTKAWILEFEPSVSTQVDPLMGWIGGGATNDQVKLYFNTKEEAVAFTKQKV